LYKEEPAVPLNTQEALDSCMQHFSNWY